MEITWSLIGFNQAIEDDCQGTSKDEEHITTGYQRRHTIMVQ